MTPYAEVIGDPIAQSKSPAIHRFWLDKLGLRSDYRATRVTTGDLSQYLDRRRNDADWRGCNVTMPLKCDILPLLTGTTQVATDVGAVNTVFRDEHGRLVGSNTDVAGFLEPLQARLRQTHYFRMARIIGTGGAARAAVAALLPHNFAIVLIGRDPDKARALLQDADPAGFEKGDHHTPPLSHFASPTDFAFDDRAGCLDLVVNASPLGMAGQPPMAFDMSHAPPGGVFYDMVTAPVRTPLLMAAEAAGFETIDGLAMLIGQAAAAFALFYGVDPPREHDAELRERLIA
ncbi:MAG: shikimate dehydrogenase [Pontixanthobacter sp.]